ncbi:MAG: ABC transporter permease [Chloroflexi bacterium]|nr:ABC transporter permease [Chloroflexota bacterium]
MLVFIIRRLLWLPLVLLVVSFITYGLGFYGPGDPVEILLGQRTNPEVVERIRHEKGLDRPFIVQYGDFVWNALQGEFGESYKYRGQAVNELIAEKVWVSSQLGFVALVIAVVLGIPLGLLAAFKHGTWADTAVVGATLIFISVPSFIVAPILLWTLVSSLHLLPSAGWNGIFDLRLVMPALVMGIPPVAVITRQTRAAVLEVVAQDYVRTARSKGLYERVVVLRHILRNALIPVFTLIGLSMGGLVEGAFITETIFGIPGIGRLGFESITSRDYPVIMALTLLVATTYVLASLAVDIGYTFLDPRVRTD